MAEIKTKETKASVTAFLKALPDEKKRSDALLLLSLMKEATGLPPKLWGNNMVGFGKYHYKSERSSQEGDWPLTGFSPRKQNLTIYIMPGFTEYGDLLKKLGKYTTSVSCLYVKRLSDIDTKVLVKLVKRSVADMKKRYT